MRTPFLAFAAIVSAVAVQTPAAAQFAENNLQIEIRAGDIDGDGLVTATERDRLSGGPSGGTTRRIRGPRRPDSPLRITVVDADKDGVFSPEEQRRARQSAPEALREDFDRAVAALDANRDGVLTRAEYEAGRGRRG